MDGTADTAGEPGVVTGIGGEGTIGMFGAGGMDPSDMLGEAHYAKPRWRYTFARTVPRCAFLTCYHTERVREVYSRPNVQEVYDFVRNLFVKAELSSECSVVCLIYVERLMHHGVLLLAENWRPIMLSGLLLASKVWQDLSSWNIEFATIYPRFPLNNINRLERTVLKLLRWDLYISASQYAKYYFALRSIGEQKNFRRKYNYMMMKSNPPNAGKLANRSRAFKQSLYSKSF